MKSMWGMSENRQAILYADFMIMIQYKKKEKKSAWILMMAFHNLFNGLMQIAPLLF